MKLPRRVRLIEVGPRDGLQNEKGQVPAAVKIELIHLLQDAGLKDIEVTSFVSPRWVPQMADAADVMGGLRRQSGVRYSALTPNMMGLERALAAGAGQVVVFGAASEAFSRRNINCSIEESIARFEPVVAAAKANRIPVRGGISMAVGCPYEGVVPARNVERVVRMMREIGVEEISVADTIGIGTPRQVQCAMEAALRHYPLEHVAGHFHDTYGQALANTLGCLQMGVWQFDTSVAGLGGCPYAAGASGNVATEDVQYMLEGLGIETGVDLRKLIGAGEFISTHLGRPPNSRVSRASLARARSVSTGGMP